MKYYHNLYLSESLLGKKEELLYKLEQKKFQLNLYVIVLAGNEKNHLEFYDSAFLLQPYWEKKSLFIVGIADGFEEAVSIVKDIAEEVYSRTKEVNIREYLLERQKEFEEREK